MNCSTQMKIRKIALLATLPAAVMVANAQADGPEVYGKLNVSLQRNDVTVNTPGADILSNWSLDSNASRFGIKGSTELDGGLKGIYKLEFSTAVDSGDATLGARNSYVGVQDTWGTAIGGKFDTPTKEIRGKIDQFADYKVADIANVLVGQQRPSNIVMYSSPKIADDITINAAIIPGENTGVSPGKHNNHAADGTSASVVYDTKDIYVALSEDSHVDSGVLWFSEATSGVDIWGTETNIIRLAAEMKIDTLVVGAILQDAKDSDTNLIVNGFTKQQGAILSAAYTMDKETFKAQFGHSKIDVQNSAQNDAKLNSISLGLDHSLGKGAKAYVYLAQVKTDNMKAGVNAQGVKETDNTLGIGFEQKF
jgi:predicted porin